MRTSDQVLRYSAVVSRCTTLSRALGFFREILMAAFFGTSLAQSAFVVAFRMPNLFRRLFGEGALAAAFVPVFTESLEKEGRRQAWTLAGRVMGMLGLALALTVVSGIVVISFILGSATLGERAVLVLVLLRIMLPYMFFICLVALSMAILNSFLHFLVPASTPILLNVVWIVTLTVVCPRFGSTPAQRIYGIAWGILVAGVLQLLVQVPLLIRYGFRGRIPLGWGRDPRVRRVLLLMGPAALGMGIFQVNTAIGSLLAFFWIGPWAPAALNFAERLIYLPLGMFATAVGTVLLPVFSKQAARMEPDRIRNTLNHSLSSLMFVMIPAATGMLVLARPIIEAVFERGEFTDWSTTLTARALCCYAPGLVVFSVYKVLVPAFYAMQDTRTPVRVGIMAVCLNLALNITFLLTWPLYFKHAGLAIATVLSSAVNAAVLARLLHHKIGPLGWNRILPGILRMLLASLLMGAAVLVTHRCLVGRLAESAVSTGFSRALSVGGSIIVGLAVYVGLAAVICREQLVEILQAVRGRTAPEQEEKS